VVEDPLLLRDEVAQENELQLAGLRRSASEQEPGARQRRTTFPALRVHVFREPDVPPARQVIEPEIGGVDVEDLLVDEPAAVDPSWIRLCVVRVHLEHGAAPCCAQTSYGLTPGLRLLAHANQSLPAARLASLLEVVFTGIGVTAPSAVAAATAPAARAPRRKARFRRTCATDMRT
jgi:hypothetical protein